jgi:hypothetical protein
MRPYNYNHSTHGLYIFSATHYSRYAGAVTAACQMLALAGPDTERNGMIR